MFQCKQCTLSNLNVSIKVNLKYKKKPKKNKENKKCNYTLRKNKYLSSYFCKQIEP